ncbi:MAG: sulfatase-like hydrolase/transferase, partial [Thermoanaerobaculia bacterium]
MPYRRILIPVVAASYAVATLDLIFVVVFTEHAALASPWVLLSSLGRSFGVILAAFVLSGIVIALPLWRFAQLPIEPLGVAIFVGLLPPVLARSLAVHKLWSVAWAPAVAFVLILPAALATYAVARARAHPESAHRWTTVSMTALVVLVEILFCVWFRIYGPRDLVPGTGWILLGCLVVIAATLVLFSRWPPARLALPLLWFLTAMSVLGAVEKVQWSSFRPEPAAASLRRMGRPVLLLTVDTLRRDALHCYDPAVESGPHIDRLAMDSIRFRNAYATAPWTLPSVVSIMTGLSPWAHGVGAAEPSLAKSIATLGERFRAAGYTTAAIGVNGVLAENNSLRRGFRDFRFTGHRNPDTLGFAVLRTLLPAVNADRVTTADVARAASGFLRAHRDRDFFLWVHFFDPHDPYRPPSAFASDGAAPPRIGRAFDIPGQEVLTGQLTYSAAEVAWMR